MQTNEPPTSAEPARKRKAKRVSVPKAIGDQVLKEYHHKCAMCGRRDPQLHHIDENPANNDTANLIPLCPNCHLQDTHSPTAPIDRDKVRLFRRCKDPFILDSRFHPIFTRFRFLRRPETVKGYNPKYCIEDLINFVESFEKGAYYAKRVRGVIGFPKSHLVARLRSAGEEEVADFMATEVENLCVEMLRYQHWQREAAEAEH